MYVSQVTSVKLTSLIIGPSDLLMMQLSFTKAQALDTRDTAQEHGTLLK